MSTSATRTIATIHITATVAIMAAIMAMDAGDTGADTELITGADTAVTTGGMIPAITTIIPAVTFGTMTITTTCLAATTFILKVIGTITR